MSSDVDLATDTSPPAGEGEITREALDRMIRERLHELDAQIGEWFQVPMRDPRYPQVDLAIRRAQARIAELHAKLTELRSWKAARP